MSESLVLVGLDSGDDEEQISWFLIRDVQRSAVSCSVHTGNTKKKRLLPLFIFITAETNC